MTHTKRKSPGKLRRKRPTRAEAAKRFRLRAALDLEFKRLRGAVVRYAYAFLRNMRAARRLALVIIFTLWCYIKTVSVFLFSFLKKINHIVQAISGVATLIGFVFLVYDLHYSILADIASPASDPTDPFLFPFSVTNNSRIFWLKEVTWGCRVVHMEIPDARLTMEGPELDFGFGIKNNPAQIAPGGVLNIPCEHAIGGLKDRVLRNLEIGVSVTYSVSFAWISLKPRRVETIFIWYPNAKTPQWIRGDLANWLPNNPPELPHLNVSDANDAIDPRCPPPPRLCPGILDPIPIPDLTPTPQR